MTIIVSIETSYTSGRLTYRQNDPYERMNLRKQKYETPDTSGTTIFQPYHIR